MRIQQKKTGFGMHCQAAPQEQVVEIPVPMQEI